MTELPRSARLVVQGEPVSPEQADVILVRTRYPWVLSEDKEWQAELEQILGLPDSEREHVMMSEALSRGMTHDWSSHFTASEKAWKRLGLIQLELLHNHQIESFSYLGPHGWCDWDGNIGCSRYDIGKWPTVGKITQEWGLIAGAFPYLTLDCQVLDEAHRVAAQWRVEGGSVRPAQITSLVRPLEEVRFTPVLFDSSWERGVSAERLRSAVEHTLSSLS